MADATEVKAADKSESVDQSEEQTVEESDALLLDENEMQINEGTEAVEELQPESSLLGDTAVEDGLNEGDGEAEVTYVDEEVEEAEGNEAEGDESKAGEEDATKEVEEEEEDEEEEEEEEGEDANKVERITDPNVMPQVNVAVLAKRKWQVKVYPLKPADFVSGEISRVFKNAKESLLYILSPGKYARGKGEMYISSVNQTLKVVHNLMKMDFQYPEINIEVIKKNDEGVIEEKAYMRFDTKLVRMLCQPIPTSRKMRQQRKLRERVIGSIFVKNLPNGTTKDMLRVMFPFAPEVNYNPEKFKDGTARLVLSNRNYVIPCLKAFAKVELGGNVLELHPLEKRKDSERSEKAATSPRRSNKSETDGRKKEDDKKKEDRSHSESRHSEGRHAERGTSKSGDKKDSKSPAEKKDAPRRGSGAHRADNDGKDTARGQDNKNRARRGWNFQRRRASLTGADRRRTGGLAGRTDSGGARGKLNRADDRKGRDAGNNRNARNQQDRNRANREGGRLSGNRNAGGFARQGARNRFGAIGGLGRGSRTYEDRRMGSALGAAAGGLDVSTEATKEMMLLQGQLSMAIKNQIAMLNQTQMAVEQAKRGAGGLGIGADLAQAGSSGVMGAVYNKRNAGSAGFEDDYDDGAYAKRRAVGLGGHMRAPVEDRGAELYGHQQNLGYGSRQEEERAVSLAENLSARNFNSGYFNAGGRAGNLSDASYGYRY